MNETIIKFEKTSFPYRGGLIRDALIKIRGHQCEDCKLSYWKNQLIPLEAHHIDGDKCNNNLNNLKLLCPNCHTLTPNYGTKNKKGIRKEISDEELINALKSFPSIRQALFSLGMSDAGANYERVRILIKNNPNLEILKDKNFSSLKKEKTCIDCGKIISLTSIRCSDCASKAQRKVLRPEREILKKEVFNESFTSLGKKYHVSDKTIQKWCYYYNLPSKRKDIKKYSKEEWFKL